MRPGLVRSALHAAARLATKKAQFATTDNRIVTKDAEVAAQPGTIVEKDAAIASLHQQNRIMALKKAAKQNPKQNDNNKRQTGDTWDKKVVAHMPNLLLFNSFCGVFATIGVAMNCSDVQTHSQKKATIIDLTPEALALLKAQLRFGLCPDQSVCSKYLHRFRRHWHGHGLFLCAITFKKEKMQFT